MKLYNSLYISENNQQNVTQFINYNTIIEKLSKDKNIEKNTEKKMAHSLKSLFNPTHKILLFGCLAMKIVQMLSMVH